MQQKRMRAINTGLKAVILVRYDNAAGNTCFIQHWANGRHIMLERSDDATDTKWDRRF